MNSDHTILVAEDERPLLEAIVKKLGDKGFATVAARTGAQVIDYLNEIENISAIWLDHYLIGEANGLDLLARIKESEKWSSIPVFVVSNTATQDKVATYMKLGINKYFVKSENKISEIVDEVTQTVLGEK